MHLGGCVVREAGYRKALRHKEGGKEGWGRKKANAKL